MNSQNQPKSMRTFLVIWFGQLISIMGSGLTGFGLTVWIFDQTGDATPLALNALFFSLPRVLLSPIAGSIADRHNRRRIMILTDTGAALVTVLVAALLFSGRLEIWHIYFSTMLSSVLNSFQQPAYQASVTMLVPKKDLVRAGGIQQMGGATLSILTPAIAGALYGLIGLRGVILIDFATFFFAIGALAIVHIPQPERVETAGDGRKSSILKDAGFGWRYLRTRPGLFGLLWYYAAVNFFLNVSGVLTAPLVLSFGTPAEMGIVQMTGGAAMLIGGVIMSTWGGPKEKRIPLIILAIGLNASGYLLYGLRPSTPLIASAAFIVSFFIPISAALSQALWQTKVAPEVQGRVFAIRMMIAYSVIPLANLSAGPLVDRVFEPLMAVDGVLGSSLLGDWIGSGDGRGVGLIFIMSAIFLLVLSLMAFLNPRIRNLESEIPDAVPDDPEVEVMTDSETVAAPLAAR